ncbi:hypothetical protein ACFLXA_01995 [Chloroflexota bacterium]
MSKVPVKQRPKDYFKRVEAAWQIKRDSFKERKLASNVDTTLVEAQESCQADP